MSGLRELWAGLAGTCCLAAGSVIYGIEPSNGVVPPAPAVSAGTGQSPYAPGPWAMPSYGSYTTRGAGPSAGTGPFWAPGGYEPRSGSPYYYHDPHGGQYVVTGNPYFDHFGPGFHRHDMYGHSRFPYYNYRAPWYYPGRAVYNRDTNLPW